MSANSRISNAFKKAKVLPLHKDTKYILFSDCHRGDNSFADDFAHNKKIYQYALSKYLEQGFTYIELGDGDELWENSFDKIFRANKEVFLTLKKFHDAKRLHFIWGNHDMVYKEEKNIQKNLYTYYDPVSETDKALFPGITFSEAIQLQYKEGKSFFLLHGHQADWFNYICWKFSRFLVRILWKPLQIIGIDDPTSPAQNFKELIKVERHIKAWILKNKNQVLVTGHTHRPRFPEPKELPYFNTGSCVHPRCITGLEIENNTISLIKWHVITTHEGTMQIKRTVLEGPQDIALYFNA